MTVPCAKYFREVISSYLYVAVDFSFFHPEG